MRASSVTTPDFVKTRSRVERADSVKGRFSVDAERRRSERVHATRGASRGAIATGLALFERNRSALAGAGSGQSSPSNG